MIQFPNINKLGTAGLFITAIFSPCCFPIFAIAATAMGLGSFELFGEWTMWVFQAMVIISIAGLVVAYIKHKCIYPLIIATTGAVLIFYGYHFNESDNWIYFLYAGMLAQLIATVVNYFLMKKHNNFTSNSNKILLESVITCPNCSYKKTELMPEDACVYFYNCENCKVRLQPEKGDCCVFCSYGSIKCPPIQVGKNCC